MTQQTRPTRPAAPHVLEVLEPRRLLAADGLSGAGGTTTPTLLPSVDVSVDATRPAGQTWEGAGASMNTWKFGGSYDTAAFYNDLVGDAGVNIVRLPLWQAFENVNDNDDPLVADLDAFDSRSMAPAMRFAQEFEKRGDMKVLLSVWTPPYWMKTNAAHNWGGALRADMYEEYAEYLSAYVQLADRDWGVDVDVVSLQNEPYFIEWYESALYTPGQMLELMKIVQDRFDRDGVDARISVHEDLNINDRFRWWEDTLMSDPQVAQSDFVWGLHEMSLGNLGPVKEMVQRTGKPMWLTESGGARTRDWGAGIELSVKMTELMNKADLSAFLDWQFDGDGHSSLYYQNKKAPRYHAMKHYSRFVRPGSERVELTTRGTDYDGDNFAEARAVAWRDPAQNAQAVIVTNWDESAAEFHLSGLDQPAAGRQWYARVSDANAQFQPLPLAARTGSNGRVSFDVTLPPDSITTFYNGPAQPVSDFTPASSDRRNTSYVDAYDAANSNVRRRAFDGEFYRVEDALRVDPRAGDATHAQTGRNALHMAVTAVRGDIVKTVQLLADHTADIDAPDREGITPLMVAASNPFVQYATDQDVSRKKVAALVDAGADLQARDDEARTPLHWAASAQQYSYEYGQDLDPRVVRYLLDVGADANKVDLTGRKPIDWATKLGNTANAEALTAWAANPANDRVGPEVLALDYDVQRGRVNVDFDEALFSTSAVRFERLATDGKTAATSKPYRTRPQALSGGNTRLESRHGDLLADGYYRVAAGTGVSDAAGNVAAEPDEVAGWFWHLAGDANRDKKVDLADFMALRQSFGKRGVGLAQGDFDYSGTVDLGDFSVLRRQFGKSLGPTPAGFGQPPVPVASPARVAAFVGEPPSVFADAAPVGPRRLPGEDAADYGVRGHFPAVSRPAGLFADDAIDDTPAFAETDLGERDVLIG